jgi:hypothetical protein
MDPALELEIGIAKTCADKYNRPFKVVKPTFGGGYVTGPLSMKTSAETVWTTEDPPPLTPVQQEWADKISKMQAELDKLKQGEENGW